ncbi:hypothetical protein Cadr_000003353 [Camelus dromedarius]|uniref:Uncharacterized protein n=1 Tax=Camelus dromedarius TaxID=9838 RepID=A0A5N4C411_CAMDR|nr:hypothetical protein Cadr_000003353 [Camelus dromedarius]
MGATNYSQDIRPGEEKKDEGASAVEVTKLFNLHTHMCRPTVISNLKNGSHQLQVKTLDLVKRKRMKEHLQWKVKGKERNASCGWVCLDDGTIIEISFGPGADGSMELDTDIRNES